MTPDPLCKAVARGLSDGLGVEDIAVRDGMNPEFIRREIKRMRDAGTLHLVVSQARERAKQ